MNYFFVILIAGIWYASLVCAYARGRTDEERDINNAQLGGGEADEQ